MGRKAYADYMAADSADAAAAAWGRVSTLSTLLNVCIGVGAGGLGLGPILLLLAPRPGTLAKAIQAVERDLAAVTSQGR